MAQLQRSISTMAEDHEQSHLWYDTAGQRAALAYLAFEQHPSLDLTGAVLVGATLQEADLRGARLDGALLGDALANGLILEHTSLVESDFTKADLVEADFTAPWGIVLSSARPV